MSAAGKDHPLVQQNDFDREQFARTTSAGGRRQQMLDYIAARRKDIETTRKALEDKPSQL